MEEDFFDILLKREGARLLMPESKIPTLEDYFNAAYLAGYHKRESIERLMDELRD